MREAVKVRLHASEGGHGPTFPTLDSNIRTIMATDACGHPFRDDLRGLEPSLDLVILLVKSSCEGHGT